MRILLLFLLFSIFQKYYRMISNSILWFHYTIKLFYFDLIIFNSIIIWVHYSSIILFLLFQNDIIYFLMLYYILTILWSQNSIILFFYSIILWFYYSIILLFYISTVSQFYYSTFYIYTNTFIGHYSIGSKLFFSSNFI